MEALLAENRGLKKENTALIAIQNCKDRKASTFYHGKRVAFIYKAKNAKTGINYKSIWGRITTSHGQSGLVRTKFVKNLPSVTNLKRSTTGASG